MTQSTSARQSRAASAKQRRTGLSKWYPLSQWERSQGGVLFRLLHLPARWSSA
jgi:hypothetical protein